MKSRFIASLAVLTLALSGALSISAFAQTTEEGKGPSEQPSAPMEIGQEQGGPQTLPSEAQPGDAQPTEAQPGGPEGEAPAESDQGVARVSLMHGDVSTQRGDSGDWSAATLNQPVMTGDKVSTGDNARTELQLDFANTFRLGPNSKATISNLTKKDIQIQLGQGIANFTVSKDSESEPEIDTPNVSVHPAHHDGVFRIEVRPDGDTIVIVRQGEAQIATPQGSTEVHAGDMATVRGNADSAQYKISQAPDRDDWDRWNSDRDHMIRNASSWKHTNHYYTGSQDLDASGNWQNVPDYGDVWVPNEPEGWAPYRDGNWTYEPTYGWTWVGYEPWGWAPYHYGRWFPYGAGWAWWPGPIYGGGFYRPFWSPAYVSFFGWGGGFGFGYGYGGWGGFGWLPIGPCDFFHPWWGGYRGRFGWAGRGGFNGYGGFRPLHGGTRFSNVANLHDGRVSRGLSTVNAGRFGAGRVTAMAASREQLKGARMMAGNLPVVPSRASLSASGRAAAPSTVRNGSERFFGSAHNNVARPASFQQQTASLRQTMQQNHVGAVPAGGRVGGGESAARGPTVSGTMQRPSAGTLSNRETNNPGNRSAGNQPSSIQNGNRGGDRPFNPPSGGTRPSGPASSERTNVGSSNTGSRGMEPQHGTMQSAPAGNRDGFRPFTPPSGNEPSRGGSNAPAARGSSGGYWNRTAPSSMEQRGSGSNSGSYGRGSSSGSSSRPQLDMRQPIVRSPSYGGYPRGGYGGSRSAPSYGGSRGAPSHGAPSYGGSHGGGGHVSAPSGGGGHSSGGGGGHSSGGGGGHSSGGGGGHSSGGHH
jgi:FecR protein